MSSLGQRLFESRKKAGLTQAQLAEKVGVSQGLVTHLESGNKNNTALIVKFAIALNVDVYWLAGEVKPDLNK